MRFQEFPDARSTTLTLLDFLPQFTNIRKCKSLLNELSAIGSDGVVRWVTILSPNKQRVYLNARKSVFRRLRSSQPCFRADEIDCFSNIFDRCWGNDLLTAASLLYPGSGLPSKNKMFIRRNSSHQDFYDFQKP